MDYQYPDRGDALTVALIDAVSPGAYWQQSEDNVLRRAFDALRGRPRVRRMLDLGCGLGRLLPVFAPFAAQLEGYEPDPQRFAAAARLAAGLPNVTVRRGTAAQAAGPYDALLCSHVLQHLPCPTAAELLRQMAALAAPGALLCLTTTYTPGGQDHFTREFFDGDRRRSEPVSVETFDAGFPLGTLPVRYFARASVERLAAEAGFSPRGCYGYHFVAPDAPGTTTYDNAQNAAGRLDGARDALYLFEKD